MPKDEILIRGDMATIKRTGGKTVKMPVAELLRLASPSRMQSCGVRIPPEVRFVYSRGTITILVCEYPPGPYTLRWITENSPAPYGPEATYENYIVSLPYVIVLAAFEGSRLSDFNECFFRTEPLRDVDSENDLCLPGLLNCSRFVPAEGNPLSWICTQKMDRKAIYQQLDPRKQYAVGLRALKQCLFEQAFNYSSDHNEFSSWYTESKDVDERISSISRWQEETRQDRFMGLDVPWLKADLSLPEVVERIFKNRRQYLAEIANAQQLARLMLNHHKS